MSESLLTMARPYAQAIFDFAVEHQALSKWELMLVYIKNIFQDRIVIRLLSYFGYLDSNQLSDILILICGHHIDCFGQNFIRIIVKNEKIYLIFEIFKEFIRLSYAHKKIVKVEITSVIPLNNNQLLSIVDLVKQKFSCTVHLLSKYDSSILGGIILRIENTIIDASIRGRIKRLTHFLNV